MELINQASDIYSLGATLSFLLTGENPRPHAERQQVLRDRKPGVPRPLDAICRRAMAAAPEDRYPRAAEVATDLQRWLADEPVIAYRERWTERLGRLFRRYQTWVRALVVSLVILVIALLVFINSLVRDLAASAREARRSEMEAARTKVDKARHERVLRIESQLNTYVKALDLEKPPIPVALDILTNTRDELRQEFSERPQDLELRRRLASAELQLFKRLNQLQRPQEATEAARNAVDHCRAIVAASKSPEDLALLATALESVHYSTANEAESQRTLNEVLEIRQSLATENPNRPEFRLQLGQTLYNVGVDLHERGRHGEAAESADQSIQIQQEVLATDFAPQLGNFKQLLETYRLKAEALRADGQTERAAAVAASAHEFLAKALQDYPSDPDLLSEQATVLHTSSLAANGAAADAILREEIAVRERALQRLVASNAAERNQRHWIAAARHDLAVNALAAGRFTDVVMQAGLAKEIFEQQLGGRDAPLQSRELWADTLYLLMEAYGQQNNRKKAAEYGALAIEAQKSVAADPKASPLEKYALGEITVYVIRYLQRDGREQEAYQRWLEAADAFMTLKEVQGDDPTGQPLRGTCLYSAACSYAQAAALASKAIADPAEVERKRAELLKAGMDAFRAAVDAGYRDVATVEGDPDNEPLRSQPGYKDLIERMKKPL
jgi:hypothetical protein